MVHKVRRLTKFRNHLFWVSLLGTVVMLGGLGSYIDSSVRARRDSTNAARAAEVVSELNAAAGRAGATYAMAEVVKGYLADTDVEVTVAAAGGFHFVIASTRAGPAGLSLQEVDDSLIPLVDEVMANGRAESRVGDLHENELRLIAPIRAGAAGPVTHVAIVRVDGSLAASEAMQAELRLAGLIFALWVVLLAVLNGFLQLHIDRAMRNVIGEIERRGEEARAAQAAAEAALTELRDYKSGLDHHALVAVFNLAGEITHVNEVYCRLSKYSRDELVGKTFRLLLPERQPTEVWKALSSHVARGEVWNGEISSRAKDGSPYFVQTTIVPLHDAQGERVHRVVVLGTDVTQRRLDQEALRLARDAAEAATQAKSAFLANMSHEIRTPMTAILGYADLLYSMEDGRNEERTEYLTTIRRNGEHLLLVINDILDLAKIEAGRLEMVLEDTDLVQVVEEVVSLMRVRALDRNLELHVEYGARLPRHVRSDGTRLKQVLLNLLGNAIKFTEAGSVTLRVGYAWGDPQSPSQLRFDVIDTGIGMTEHQMQGLFRPFQQADASTTRRFGGTGLGLHICQRLVGLLGGQLTVTSRLGAGSHFVATMTAAPVGRELVEVAAGSAAVTGRLLAMAGDGLERRHGDTAAPIRVNDHTLRGVRILLAEDGPDNQRLIALHLRKAGAAVTVAENGRVALELLTSTGTADGPFADPLPFDLVVTDMQMPEMDGYELTRTLRRRGWSRPVIALTAHAMAGDAEKCYAAGCDAYATKPIDRDALISLCASHARFDASAVGSAARDPLATTMIVERPHFDDPDMQALAAEFAAVLPERIDEIVDALAAADRDGLRRCAHRLKGAAGGYGYPTISTAARELEEAADHGRTLTVPMRRLTAVCDAAARLARETDDDELGHAVAGELVEADGTAGASRRRVLLVDDSLDLAKLVVQHLRALDVDVQHAIDGRRAVAMAQQSSLDLVLLDFDLPVMNGLVVMEKLRALPQTAHVPIIFLTGSDNQELQMTAFDKGANDFIRKPFQPAELKARVRAALHTQALLAELERQATHDRLTGLPNRALLYARLNDAIEEHRANPDLHYALLFLDFDGFKKLNDTYGHEAGDKLLLEFAGRLRKATRHTDSSSRVRAHGVPARLGGDEFVVLLTRLRRPEDADVVVTRIESMLAPPYTIQGRQIASSASIGIARGSKAYRAADEVVRDADVAMYVAKSRGGGCSVVFKPAMQETAAAASARH